jgi:hypothetical protein
MAFGKTTIAGGNPEEVSPLRLCRFRHMQMDGAKIGSEPLWRNPGKLFLIYPIPFLI